MDAHVAVVEGALAWLADPGPARTVLVASLAVTSALVGLVWTVQLVLYPLFTIVPEAASAAYHAQHARRITWVVGPLMIVEAALAVALLGAPAEIVSTSAARVAMALVAVVWLSTAFVQVPLHRRAEGEGRRAALRALVATNWVRTAAWTARAVVLAAAVIG